MANRNNSAISPSDASVAALAYFNADAWIQQPNGTFLIEAGGARDHMAVRTAQLAGLLSLMSIDGAKGFMQLPDLAKQQLLWMATELAEEVQVVLPLATQEAGRAAREACGGVR